MRRGALLNEAQNCGRSPTSVAGGVNAFGNCPVSTGFCGPGSTALRGLLCLFTMPCDGSSGLPKVAASAVVAVAVPAAAPAARMLRRERVFNRTSKSSPEDPTVLRDRTIKDFHLLRTGSSAQGSFVNLLVLGSLQNTSWFPSKLI